MRRTLVVVVAVVVLFGCSSGGTSAPATTTTETVAPETSEPETTAATGPTLKEWSADNSQLVGNLGEALDRISTAASAQDFTALEQRCSEFSDLLDRAKATDPIPDSAMNTHWQRALTLFGSAATLCQEAVNEVSVVKLEQVSGFLQQGTAEINETARLLGEAT